MHSCLWRFGNNLEILLSPKTGYIRVIGLLLLAIFSAGNIAVAQEQHRLPPVDAVAKDAESLIPVPIPNLDRVEPEVRERLRTAHRELTSLRDNPEVTKLGLGEAYGELGRIYHAHKQYDSAEACYRNAEKLLTKDTRWSYLLGYLYQQQARFAEAAADFQRTLALFDYPQARFRLSQVLLGLNRVDEAESLLKQVLKVAEFRGAAAFELGRAALAKQQYTEAVKWLTMASKEQPKASRVHYPLAMAYRGAGNVDAAKYHLKQRGETDPTIPDPMVEELAELRTGIRTRQYLAMRAIWDRQFDVAAEEFRVILASAPDNISARVSLGRCLYLLGDRDGAEQEFSLALKQDPEHDKANYFMGRLLLEGGHGESAMGHFRTSIKRNPEHAGAQFFLGDGLLEKGDFQQAAYHFAQAAKLLPEDLVTRQREAAALIRAGAESHAWARERISEALSIHPQDPLLTRQLVQILAASPNPDIRDGQHALTLAVDLFNRQNSIENAQMVAMAYGELQEFDQAVAYQQAAIDAASQYGSYQYAEFDLLARLKNRLAFYLAQQPYRIP